ncbi:MAG: DUF4404 family protein [Planctomycetota bacterium]|nr:MAG: DUF4404 family protein [Planctomycetota bacterium]
MSEHHEKLRQALENLGAQLDELRELDPAVAEHLDANLSQARGVLAGQPVEDHEHRSSLEQLQDAVLKYEASHPRLSEYLGSVIDALGQMGI